MHMLYQRKQKVHPHYIAHNTPPKVAVLLYCGLQSDAFQGPISNRTTDDGDKAYKMHCTATHDWDSSAYSIHADRDLKKFQDLENCLK